MFTESNNNPPAKTDAIYAQMRLTDAGKLTQALIIFSQIPKGLTLQNCR